MNTVKEFKISISLWFVLYSFVAVSAWVFSDEILKRKAHEFKIGEFCCSRSTYCFVLGFQHQNLQDFTEKSRALNKDIFPVAEANPEYLSNRL